MASKRSAEKDIKKALGYLDQHPAKCGCPTRADCDAVRSILQRIIVLNQERLKQYDK